MKIKITYHKTMPTEQEPERHPHPPKQRCIVSPLAIKDKERVKEASLVIGRVTVAVAGGEREDGRASLGGTADYGEWSPGWPGRYACQGTRPPYLG